MVGRVCGALLIALGIFVCIGGASVETAVHTSADGPLGPLAVVNFAGQHTQIITEMVGSVMFLSGIILTCTASIVDAIRRIGA